MDIQENQCTSKAVTQSILIMSLQSFCCPHGLPSASTVIHALFFLFFFLIHNNWIYKFGRKIQSEKKVHSKRKRRTIKIGERSVQEKEGREMTSLAPLANSVN